MVGNQEFTTHNEIQREAVKFFTELYTEDQTRRPKVDNLEFTSISEVQKLILERSIEIDEVLQVIKNMPTNKSPGPDDMPNEFFKASWSTLKEDFMLVIKHFQNGGKLEWRLNCTFICLIPKRVGATQFKDFRTSWGCLQDISKSSCK